MSDDSGLWGSSHITHASIAAMIKNIQWFYTPTAQNAGMFQYGRLDTAAYGGFTLYHHATVMDWLSLMGIEPLRFGPREYYWAIMLTPTIYGLFDAIDPPCANFLTPPGRPGITLRNCAIWQLVHESPPDAGIAGREPYPAVAPLGSCRRDSMVFCEALYGGRDLLGAPLADLRRGCFLVSEPLTQAVLTGRAKGLLVSCVNQLSYLGEEPG